MRSRSNWYLEMLIFEERGKAEYPEKNLSDQRNEPPGFSLTRLTLVGGGCSAATVPAPQGFERGNRQKKNGTGIEEQGEGLFSPPALSSPPLFAPGTQPVKFRKNCICLLFQLIDSKSLYIKILSSFYLIFHFR